MKTAMQQAMTKALRTKQETPEVQVPAQKTGPKPGFKAAQRSMDAPKKVC